MPACVPRIIGPVTSWSRTLLVEGALPGATILVREGGVGGVAVAKAVAGGGRDRIPLLPGIALTAGQPLFVSQQAGEASGWTRPDLAETVGWPPADWARVPPPWFRSRLHACGRAAWVSGCVPGAQVTVTGAGGDHGAGPADEGQARLRFGDPFPAGNVTVSALQAAPAGMASPTGLPMPVLAAVQDLPAARGQALPQVVIGPPLPSGCDSALVIRNVVDGAEVTVARPEGGIVEKALFDLDSLTYVLASRLDPAGGRIDVTQGVGERCGVGHSPARTVGFGPAARPPAPVPQPPCAGSAFLWVTGLRGGAEVEIDVAGTLHRGMVAPAATEQLFELAPMQQGDPVSVVQKACGIGSDAGATVVGPASAGGLPRLVRPLFRCARVVRVAGVTPGALVRLIAKGPSGGSPVTPFRWCGGTTIALEVSPPLVEGEDIFAEQIACGGPALFSDPPAPVEPLPDPLPVEIAFAFATQRSATVVALPGALVRVFSRRDGIEEIGWGLVDPDHDRIPLKRALLEDETLFAVQEICGLVSRDGPGFRVRPGEKVFQLPAPKHWPVPSAADGKDVIWLKGRLLCRIDGDYRFFVKCANKAEGSTADIDASVELTHPAGLGWGAHVSMFLAAAKAEGPNKAILAKGYKAEDEDTTTGLQPGWREPAQWNQVLNADAAFSWVVAIWTFPETEADDAEDEENGRPPPSP